MYIILPGHWLNGSIVRQWYWGPGFNPKLSHTKDSKMALDVTLLNIQHYKVQIKGKVEQFREWSCALFYSSIL